MAVVDADDSTIKGQTMNEAPSGVRSSLKVILAGAAIAVLIGLLAVLVPAFLLPMKPYESPVFPVVRTAIEGITPFTYVGLFIGGLVLGWFFPYGAALGLLTMTPFYASAITEMIVDPHSHKLWPLEFVIYLALSLLAVLGGLGATWVRRSIRQIRN
jgi:hypothetical protein